MAELKISLIEGHAVKVETPDAQGAHQGAGLDTTILTRYETLIIAHGRAHGAGGEPMGAGGEKAHSLPVPTQDGDARATLVRPRHGGAGLRPVRRQEGAGSACGDLQGAPSRDICRRQLGRFHRLNLYLRVLRHSETLAHSGL
jgi:hypothetical protein